MQKIYSRINWENSPSANTPLGENNLNAMDYALDEIDTRVVNLYGYQDRVSESELNAKTSENNAKQSALNAKQSELLAKEYKDKAFTYTPDGYEDMVDEVFGLDIKSSTKSPLLNTRNGGLRFNNIVGASVQSGTPTPDSPIAIKNTFDCVEMIQGYYNRSTGVFTSSTAHVCTKNKIPCKSGDVIKFITEEILNSSICFFANDTFLSANVVTVENVTEISATAPSGATHFTFHTRNTDGVTPDTVGKITLTINGKYVALVKTSGKNLLSYPYSDSNKVQASITWMDNGDGTICANGTSSGATNFIVGYYDLPVGDYIFSKGVADSKVYVQINKVSATNNSYVGRYYIGTGDTIAFTVAEGDVGAYRVQVLLRIESGVTVSNLKFYPMIRKADITDDTYEPYQESLARVLLNEPLRQDDVMDRTEVNRKMYRTRLLSTWSWSEHAGGSTGGNGLKCFQTTSDLPFVKITSEYEKANALCTHFPIDTFANIYNNTSTIENSIGVTTLSSKTYFRVRNTNVTSLTEFLTWLDENEVYVEYELATPTTETLDTESQIALNSLETFNGATYLEFDSVVQPSEFEVEYGTSKVGAYTLKSLLNSEANKARLEELRVALVSLTSEV